MRCSQISPVLRPSSLIWYIISDVLCVNFVWHVYWVQLTLFPFYPAAFVAVGDFRATSVAGCDGVSLAS